MLVPIALGTAGGIYIAGSVLNEAKGGPLIRCEGFWTSAALEALFTGFLYIANRAMGNLLDVNPSQTLEAWKLVINCLFISEITGYILALGAARGIKGMISSFKLGNKS